MRQTSYPQWPRLRETSSGWRWCRAILLVVACGSCAGLNEDSVDREERGPPVVDYYLPVGCTGETEYTPAENERLRLESSTITIDGTKVANPLEGIPGLIPLGVLMVREGEDPWTRMKDQMRLKAGRSYWFRVNTAGRLGSGTAVLRLEKDD